MSESYKGFTIECERTDAASSYMWWVVGIDGHPYGCDGREYENSGDAERAAEQWIDWYIKSLPNTDTIKTILEVQERLKAIEEELQKLTNSPYTNHYKPFDEGAKMVTQLFCALEDVTESLKINEQIIRNTSRENG
ncbi:hypothetical protein [Aulosira sp. FACHB-615]|uniref:hypothetical protein n=1 Tax=Aulosira sp. FACHB-615 TaxID=2692777 RepID=UPI001683D19E|nr:hypothetical protein [Aulosira sp. FACHB-615]MBD2491120.1 hypothetical protein [Aulosira sp. FACHB-615]